MITSKTALSLVDIDDFLVTGQNVAATLTALGLPNFDQANRAAALQLYKSVNGNTYVQFETSVKGVGLQTRRHYHVDLREGRVQPTAIPGHEVISGSQFHYRGHHGTDP